MPIFLFIYFIYLFIYLRVRNKKYGKVHWVDIFHCIPLKSNNKAFTVLIEWLYANEAANVNNCAQNRTKKSNALQRYASQIGHFYIRKNFIFMNRNITHNATFTFRNIIPQCNIL